MSSKLNNFIANNTNLRQYFFTVDNPSVISKNNVVLGILIEAGNVPGYLITNGNARRSHSRTE